MPRPRKIDAMPPVVPPEVKSAIQALQAQHPGAAYLKIFRIDPAGPTYIADPGATGFHKATWDDVLAIEAWISRQAHIGPGQFKVHVYTEDADGRPAQKPIKTFETAQVQSAAAVRQVAAAAASAAAAVDAEVAKHAVVHAAQTTQALLTDDVPRASADLDRAMASGDVNAIGVAMQAGSAVSERLKSSTDALAAQIAAFAGAVQRIPTSAAPATPIPGVTPLFTPPLVGPAGYGAPPQPQAGQPQQPQWTPQGWILPGGGFAPHQAAAPKDDKAERELAEIRRRLEEADKRAAESERKAEIARIEAERTAERLREENRRAEDQRRADERIALMQRELDAKIAQQQREAELRHQQVLEQIRLQATAQKPTDDGMIKLMLSQQAAQQAASDAALNRMQTAIEAAQTRAQAMQEKMIEIATAPGPDSSEQMQKMAEAMGNMTQSAMSIMAQSVRAASAAAANGGGGQQQPPWLGFAARAIDTLGEIAAATMGGASAAPAPQVAPAPIPQQIQVAALPPAPAPAPAALPPAQAVPAQPASAPMPPPAPEVDPRALQAAAAAEVQKAVAICTRAQREGNNELYNDAFAVLDAAFGAYPFLLAQGEDPMEGALRLLSGALPPHVAKLIREAAEGGAAGADDENVVDTITDPLPAPAQGRVIQMAPPAAAPPA